MQTLLPLVAIFFGGVAVAIQAGVNGGLSRALGAVLPAATISFGVGFVLLLGLSLLVNGAASYARLPGLPLWLFAGGVLGAYYVWSMVFGIPQLGVVTAMAALILGQMTAALMLDASGAFGMAVQAISPTRILAVAMVAGGVLLSRL